MRPLVEASTLAFQETILEGLRKLSIEDIAGQSDLARMAREVLEIDQKVKELDAPLNLTGPARETINILQDRLNEQHQLRQRRSRLCWCIIVDAQNLFSEMLVAYLTKAMEPHEHKH
ncbi:MAG: hypothetical protein A2751_02605 [Candidatus Doudnabacteria bacterium RIFCSPHIGHO2_01_FULL_46_14]|uniref:Uncharacterized protein n=1 Tax=Candidatus Doudnabacteria bacterium RIFCSPHIGHO2_01_FULL_46_14 TaxID=1817824 RepID=A0A1F5NK77_9BACT|nr:MAG: hypothetical protein A2751_02605 [Candidatus Doudnabacteria bacterium RIFCSPHIGHO2_01_FULL_46_14]